MVAINNLFVYGNDVLSYLVTKIELSCSFVHLEITFLIFAVKKDKIIELWRKTLK